MSCVIWQGIYVGFCLQNCYSLQKYRCVFVFKRLLLSILRFFPCIASQKRWDTHKAYLWVILFTQSLGIVSFVSRIGGIFRLENTQKKEVCYGLVNLSLVKQSHEMKTYTGILQRHYNESHFVTMIGGFSFTRNVCFAYWKKLLHRFQLF